MSDSTPARVPTIVDELTAPAGRETISRAKALKPADEDVATAFRENFGIGDGGAALNPRGVWDAEAAYAEEDWVTFNGSSYICIAAHTGAQPDTSPESWQLWAQAGAAGVPGPGGAALN